MGDMDIFEDDVVYYAISMGFVDVSLQKASDLISDPRSSVADEMYGRTGGLTPLRIFALTLPLKKTYLSLIMPAVEWETKENLEMVQDAMDTFVPGYSSDGAKESNPKEALSKLKEITRITEQATLLLIEEKQAGATDYEQEKEGYIYGIMDQSFEDGVIARAVDALGEARSQYMIDPEIQEELISADEVLKTVNAKSKQYFRRIIEEYYPVWLRTRSIHGKGVSGIVVFLEYQARAYVEA